MTPADMKRRTRQFALRVIKLVNALPKSAATSVMGYQLLKAGTSVASNYRASCRAKSVADFISKMGVVEEECDEAIFWMEMLVEASLIRADRVADLIREGNEILKIVVASINTARRGKRSQSAIRNPQSAIASPGGART
ncbi:MAG TPA: four helix bundle protein [Planctomycetota bacterium]|nr:four helix bundle protein [Planctomycetota bacterium]